MNDKIKEIMYKVDDINLLNGFGEDADFLADIDSQRLDKFAELIVKECMDVIERDIQYNQMILHADTSYKIHNLASLKGAIGQIKNHFGVE